MTKLLRRRSFATALVCTVAVAAVTGCAFLKANPTVTQRLATATKLAMFVGTKEYLRQHPGERQKFVDVMNSITLLESSSVIDGVTVAAVLDQLPIKELKSERAQLLISATTIALSDSLGNIPVSDEARLFLTAAREGLELGLSIRTASSEEQRMFQSDSLAKQCFDRQKKLAVVKDLQRGFAYLERLYQ